MPVASIKGKLGEYGQIMRKFLHQMKKRPLSVGRSPLECDLDQEGCSKAIRKLQSQSQPLRTVSRPKACHNVPSVLSY